MIGKVSNSQAGFGAVEALLVLVIIGLLGFTSYFVWHTKQTTNKTLQANTSTTPAYKKQNIAGTQGTTSDAQLAKAFKGYELLPADFRPLLKSEYKKTVMACVSKPSAKANGDTAGGQVEQVVREHFVSINEQQVDCGGGSTTYYSKVNGTWQRDFVASMAPGCDVVTTYHYTKVIIPDCYPAGSAATVKNTNP